MDKAKILGILGAYCPPLSSAQIDALAEEIVQASRDKVKPLFLPLEREEDFSPHVGSSGKSTRKTRRLMSQV